FIRGYFALYAGILLYTRVFCFIRGYFALYAGILLYTRVGDAPRTQNARGSIA
ncbi:hypothetical protein JOC94_001186, partial [Bacillus thermophilus]|nr:hypothetical protein [Siminovitchia thermophila]